MEDIAALTAYRFPNPFSRLCSNFIMKGQLNEPCGALGK